MSVTPLNYDPPGRAAPLPMMSSPDRAHAVIELLPAYLELADRVSPTEFVPKGLRNRPAAVLAALLSGAERGFGPMESLRSVHVIEGTPTLSAEAKRALVLAAGHTFEVLESTAVKCEVLGRRAGSQKTTTFTWTMDRARRARLANKDNWQRYPESMLLARATSELCNAVFPDVTAGLRTTEEVADEGAPELAVVEATTTARRAPARRPPPVAARPAPELAAAAPVAAAAEHPTDMVYAVEEEELDGIPGEPWRRATAPVAEPAPHDETLARRLHAEMAKAFPDVPAATRDRWRHALVALTTRKRPDGPVCSSSDLNTEEQLALSNSLARIIAGQATVADGPDGTVEVRAGGGWRYTITLEPLAVVGRRGDASPDADAGTPDNPSAPAPDETDDNTTEDDDG